MMKAYPDKTKPKETNIEETIPKTDKNDTTTPKEISNSHPAPQ
jgi:hypothetical protein